MIALETTRLHIRSWRPDETAAASTIFCDPEVMKYIPAGTFAQDAVPLILARMIENEANDGFGIWAVEEKEGGAVIGECGINWMPDRSAIEITWLFARSAWGKGYAFEAAQAVLAHALGPLGIQRIYALIHKENKRSITLVNRLAMSFDRVVRAYKHDMLRYVNR